MVPISAEDFEKGKTAQKKDLSEVLEEGNGYTTKLESSMLDQRDGSSRTNRSLLGYCQTLDCIQRYLLNTSFDIKFETMRETLIWVAQAIDAEGSIIGAKTYSGRLRIGISACNKNKEWVLLVSEIVPEFKEGKLNKSPFGLYYRTISAHNSVRNVLERLIPFLTIKQKLAKVGLEIVELSLHKGSREYTDEEKQRFRGLELEFQEARFLSTENPAWGENCPRSNSKYLQSKGQ